MITVGAIEDSCKALRYVKHSISSMWTLTYGQLVRSVKGYDEMTYFIYEYQSKENFSNTLIDVPLHNLINLSSQFVGDLRTTTFHKTSHYTHDILPTLRSHIRPVQFPRCNTFHYVYGLLLWVRAHMSLILDHTKLPSVLPSNTLINLVLSGQRRWEKNNMTYTLTAPVLASM